MTRRRFITLDRKEFWAESYGDCDHVLIPEAAESSCDYVRDPNAITAPSSFTGRLFLREKYVYSFVPPHRVLWVEYREGWTEPHTAWSIEGHKAKSLTDAARAVRWKD